MITEVVALPPLDSNCYFLTDEATGEMAVVDISLPTGTVMEKVKQNASKIKYIIFTHRHCDHLLGAKAAKELTGAQIAIHSLDACGLVSSEDSLFSSLGYMYGFEQEFAKADIMLGDGDVLTLGESQIKIMHTPGHTAGSICLVYDDSIITGDLLFENSIGRTDFPTGSIEQMNDSLEKLKNMNKDYVIYPGHYGKTTLSRELSMNPFIPR